VNVQDPNALQMATIYDHPTDYPDDVVVRCCHVHPGGGMSFDVDCDRFQTVEEARAFIESRYPWMVLIQPHGTEGETDPHIYEVWC